MKNIEDKHIIYLRKILRANFYWYGKTAFVNDSVVDGAVNRILSAITNKYSLVPKELEQDADDS